MENPGRTGNKMEKSKPETTPAADGELKISGRWMIDLGGWYISNATSPFVTPLRISSPHASRASLGCLMNHIHLLPRPRRPQTFAVALATTLSCQRKTKVAETKYFLSGKAPTSHDNRWFGN